MRDLSASELRDLRFASVEAAVDWLIKSDREFAKNTIRIEDALYFSGGIYNNCLLSVEGGFKFSNHIIMLFDAEGARELGLVDDETDFDIEGLFEDLANQPTGDHEATGTIYFPLLGNEPWFVSADWDECIPVLLAVDTSSFEHGQAVRVQVERMSVVASITPA